MNYENLYYEIEEIAKNYSEVEIVDGDYNENGGYVNIWGNPYEEQAEILMNKLKKIPGIKKIELTIAQDKEEDYDILKIEF